VVASRVFQFDGSGASLTGERWAGGENGIVVLLHGGGQTRHSWGRTAERLASSGWTAVALDLRGHGDSEWAPDQDYETAAFVGDLLAYLEPLNEPAVLVGASLGGITSLIVAGEHPELVRALVLVDVVVQLEAAGVDRIEAFLNARPDGFESLEEVAAAIAAYNPIRQRPTNLDGLRKNVRRGDDGRWYWHWDPAFMRAGSRPRRHIARLRLEGAAEQLSLPTLVVHGGRSDVVSDEGVRDMVRRVPHAQVVDVAAAAHMVAGDDNDVFTAALDRFLAELKPM
jgi:pimeloyl-ACP methyl ester carboxylesterase